VNLDTVAIGIAMFYFVSKIGKKEPLNRSQDMAIKILRAITFCIVNYSKLCEWDGGSIDVNSPV
jgi:hypothetical protein